MPFPSRGKNNVRYFSSSSSFSAFQRAAVKTAAIAATAKEKFAFKTREREPACVSTRVRLLRAMLRDVQTTAKCATFVTPRWKNSREKRTYFHRMKMISFNDEGFLRSASMILASEIGDKTFFIAAILAMNHSRLTVRDEKTRLI